METKGELEKYLHLFLTSPLNEGAVAANLYSRGTDFFPFVTCD